MPTGIPATTAQVQALAALQARVLGSGDRIEDYGRWLFGSSAVLGSLAAGLNVSGVVQPYGKGLCLFGVSVALFGASLGLATMAIAPKWQEMRLQSPGSILEAIQDTNHRRKKWVGLSTLAFVLSLCCAGFVPLASAGSKAADDERKAAQKAPLQFAVDYTLLNGILGSLRIRASGLAADDAVEATVVGPTGAARLLMRKGPSADGEALLEREDLDFPVFGGDDGQENHRLTVVRRDGKGVAHPIHALPAESDGGTGGR